MAAMFDDDVDVNTVGWTVDWLGAPPWRAQ
jgi:hypothetical protein